MKRLLLFLLSLCCSVPAFAQSNWSTVTANAITDASGAVLLSGTICFQPVNYQLLPTAFTAGGGGVVHSEPACRTVTNGVMPSLPLAASNYTSPVGIQYRITVNDDTADVPMFLGYAYITGASFDLDQWSATHIFTIGAPGQVFISGPLSASGDITAPAFHGVSDSTLAWKNVPNGCPAGEVPTSQDMHGNWTNCVQSSAQTSGSASGAIAQNPSGNQMITLLSGSFQRVGSTASSMSIDVNGNIVAPSVTGNISYGAFVAGSSAYVNIQAAVNAAAAASPVGSVVIPSTYTATDTWTNVHNVMIRDNRQVGANGHYATTTVKAADYGAQCSGGSDDTAAIQAAVNAAAVISGGALITPFPLVPATVELPQGWCIIRSPIVMTGWGSIEGQGNGTYLQAAEPWTGGNGRGMIEFMNPYNAGSANLPGGYSATSSIGRFVHGINFQYAASTHAITGVRIYNQTGTASNMPYPPSANTPNFQIPGVRIEDNLFYAMDTGIDVEDCGECFIDHNQIFFVKNGIIQGGNSFSLSVAENAIQQGSWQFTPNASGNTIGYESYAEVRWGCSNASAGCATGTPSQTVIVSPQGCGVLSGVITTFDIDADLINCQGGTLSGGYDYGNAGPNSNSTTTNPTILIGASSALIDIRSAYVANFAAAGIGIEVGAPTSNAGAAETYNDLTIENNKIVNYASGVTGAAIQFDTGSFARRGVLVDRNNVFDWNYGIAVLHPVQYSWIRDNYGSNMVSTGALVQMNSAGGVSAFVGTHVSGNDTSTVGTLAFHAVSGTGFILEGVNQSQLTQFLGTQTASATGCTITAGAIGNSCSSPTSVTITWPQSFVDSSYVIDGCVIQSPSGAVTPTNVGILNATSMSVSESALSTSATGGGIITCTATHQ